MRIPYRLKNGTIVPSVTTIIDSQLAWNKRTLIAWSRREVLAGNDPDVILRAAGDVGIEVHSLIERHIKGLDMFVDISDESRRSFGAFLTWESQNSLDYIHSELRVVSEEHEYGGTIDIIARSGDVLWLVDPKSSKDIYDEFILQVSAYEHAFEAEHEKVDEVHLLHLDKTDGGFTDYHIPDDKLNLAWSAFLHCRELYKIQRELAK